MFKKLFLILSILCTFYQLYPKVDPKVKFLEISHREFTIIFPAQYLQEAQKLLKSAPPIYDELVNYWGNRVNGRIRILLTDQFDYSNGSATFFPFNTIEIFMKPPNAETPLGKYNSWLNMVLCHELTHLINFHAGNSFLKTARKVTGTNPFFYPTAILPTWFLEGTAVYSESQSFPEGRLNTSNYKTLLKLSSSTGTVPKWYSLDWNFTQWTGGTAPYLYGSGFIKYLSIKYGKKAPAEIIQKYVNSPIILPIEHTLKRYTDLSMKNLWKDYIGSIEGSSPNSTYNKLSNNGFHKGAPLETPQKELIFFYQNNRELSGLYSIRGNGQGRYLNRQQGVNSRLFIDKHKIWYSALENHKDFATYSDLFYYNTKTGKTVKVTKGRRLFSPVIYNREILCIKRSANHFRLVKLDGDLTSHNLSENHENIQDLTISPSGKKCVASFKKKEKRWEVGVMSLNSGKIEKISPESIDCYSPIWDTDHSILFLGEKGKSVQLFRYDTNNGKVKKHYGPLPDLYKLGSCSSDHLLLTGYTHEGLEIFKLNRNQLKWGNYKTDSSTFKKTYSYNSKTPEETKKYSPLRDLLPKYFAPLIREGGEELQPGIMLSGNDVLKRHNYAGEVYYGFKTKKTGYRVSYIYDGFTPTLAIYLSNLHNRHKNKASGEVFQNNLKINGGLFFTLLSGNRSNLRLYTGYYRERVKRRGITTSSTDLGGLKLALLFNSSKIYRDSISPSDGLKFTLSYTRDQEELGSDYNINTVSLDYRHYISLFRPATLALRLGVADSGGDAGKIFYMGGKGESQIPSIASSDIFTLLRGYPQGYIYGTGGWIFNCEVRIPLFNLERGYWFISSFERIWLTLFFDAGNLWQKDVKIDPLKSLGGELNLRLKMGIMDITVSTGVGFPLDTGSPKIYLRLGSSL